MDVYCCRGFVLFLIFLINLWSVNSFGIIPSENNLIKRTHSYNNGYLFENEFYALAQKYIELLEVLPTDVFQNLPEQQKTQCFRRYSDLISDDILDIRIALGYFDWTNGNEIPGYGYSPSMDLGAFSALENILQDHCTGRLQFCGFKQSHDDPSLFFKEITIFNKKITARIKMNYSSDSEFYEDNTKINREEQNKRSSYMDKFFSDGLKQADALFYFGHSRKGGGPDFHPPILNSARRVNYDGYYFPLRPGFKKMMMGLSNTNEQTKIFGLMSCDSRDLFLKPIRKIATNTGVISSTAILELDQVFTAMIGAIDALLRGQCQRSFYKEIRMTPENKDFITMDGMFE